MGQENELEKRLEAKGLSRRDFVKFCTLVSAAMGLGPSFAPKIAEALAATALAPSRPPDYLNLGYIERLARVDTEAALVLSKNLEDSVIHASALATIAEAASRNGNQAAAGEAERQIQSIVKTLSSDDKDKKLYALLALARAQAFTRNPGFWDSVAAALTLTRDIFTAHMRKALTEEERTRYATVGITDHAQHELTDVVFVELPAVGRNVKTGEACAVVESVKTASDIYSPVSGVVKEVCVQAGQEVEAEVPIVVVE